MYFSKSSIEVGPTTTTPCPTACWDTLAIGFHEPQWRITTDIHFEALNFTCLDGCYDPTLKWYGLKNFNLIFFSSWVLILRLGFDPQSFVLATWISGGIFILGNSGAPIFFYVPEVSPVEFAQSICIEIFDANADGVLGICLAWLDRVTKMQLYKLPEHSAWLVHNFFFPGLSLVSRLFDLNIPIAFLNENL